MIAQGNETAGAAAAALRGRPLPDSLAGNAERIRNRRNAAKISYDRVSRIGSHNPMCNHSGYSGQEAPEAKQATDRTMPPESIKTRQFRWGEMAKIVDWLQQVMTERGLTQSDVARLLGVERQTIYKILRGKRRLTSDELVQLQTKLGISTDLPSHPEQSVNAPHYPSINYVRVVGEVAGGLWRDVTYSDFEEFEIPIVSDPRWPREALSALVVRGQSINRKASDGDYVLTLDINHAPRSFREDDWVVVERRDGDKVETTVKRVGRNGDGEWLLLPDSTDPRWQEPLHLIEGQAHDGIEVRVTAFVLDFIKPATKL